MSNFSYKKIETTSMKVAGLFDVNTMSVDVDGEMKSLKTLLSVFSELPIEINIKVKDEFDLEEPVVID